jgi:hypothetical protein
VAEHFDGQDYLVYARDHTSIVRKRTTDAFTTNLATFDDLGDIGAMTVSIPGQHWGFLTISASQFLADAPTVGLCDATFNVTEQAHLSSIRYEGSTVTLRFATVAGRLYQLESTGDLTGAEWIPTQTEFVGTGVIVSITEPASALANRFYRLRVVR